MAVRIHHEPVLTTNGCRGIRDWEIKRDALRALFGVWADRELAKAILGLTDTESSYSDDVENLAGSFKSWYDHNPTGVTGTRFVRCLETRLSEKGCIAKNIRAVIVNGTYLEFYALLPDDVRAGLPTPTNSGLQNTEDRVRDEDPYHNIWISRNAVSDTAKAGFRRGRIDQKLYYLSPDSVDIWKGVVDAGQYRQYDECKSALHAVTEEAVWCTFFSSELADGAIMLGGGAPPKDLSIIRSMLELVPQHIRVNYALVDFSYYMLTSSFHLIDATLINEKRRVRVNLIPIVWDFVDLSGAGARLRRPGKNVVWLLPGGTIGNLNERHLFGSVARESMPGDLLVIGAETIAFGDEEASTALLINKYCIPEVQKFVETPLRSVWHELKLDGNIQKVLDRVAVHVVDGVYNDHSSVPKAATVEISLGVNKRKIVLLTSTRYDEGAFVAFAATFGFKHEGTVPSPLNPRYKQFVFRCVATDASSATS